MDAKLCDCCGKVMEGLSAKALGTKQLEVSVEDGGAQAMLEVQIWAVSSEKGLDICPKCRKDLCRKVVAKAMDEMIVRREKGAKGKSRLDDF